MVSDWPLRIPLRVAVEVARQDQSGTLMMVYFPIIFIRKLNNLLKTMERIEANTRSRTP
jgi:hypothetical protein